MRRMLMAGVAAGAVAYAMTMLTQRFPPSMIAIATGPPGGAYETVSKAYRAELARRGTQVDLVPSKGSPDNLRLLHDPRSGVVAALVQGGIMTEADQADLESLGTVMYEPLLVFTRGQACAPVCGMAGLLGVAHARVSIGGPDSGTQVLARRVLQSFGAGQSSEWQPLPPREAREALLAGRIDAVFLVEAFDAPNVREMFADLSVRLMEFPSASALIQISPTLHHVVLPRGARDVVHDLPPRDLDLVAPKASLVVRQDLHPAIKYQLLEAMRRVHSRPSMFTKSNEFPAGEAIGLRLSETARMFYSHSEPWYYEALPHWVADVIAGAVAIVVPVWALLYAPLARMLRAAQQ